MKMILKKKKLRVLSFLLALLIMVNSIPMPARADIDTIEQSTEYCPECASELDGGDHVYCTVCEVCNCGIKHENDQRLRAASPSDADVETTQDQPETCSECSKPVSECECNEQSDNDGGQDNTGESDADQESVPESGTADSEEAGEEETDDSYDIWADVDEDSAYEILKIGFLDKKYKDISFWNADSYLVASAANCPEYFILTTEYQDFSGDPAVYWVDTFDDDFYNEVTSYHFYLEDKYFSSVVDVEDGEVYATVKDSEDVTLFCDIDNLDVGTNAWTVGIGGLSGTYQVANLEVGGDGSWFVELVPDEEWPSGHSYVWIRADALEDLFTEPLESETQEEVLTEKTENGIGVSVQGILPEGTRLVARNAETEVELEQFDIEEIENVVAVLDISLQDSKGEEYQPSSNDDKVLVTVNAETLGIYDGSVLRIHHKHEDEITVIDPVVVINGKIMFAADQFSIFLVENVGDVADTANADDISGTVYEMEVGETVIFYSDNINFKPEWNRKKHTWSVVDLSGVLSWQSYNKYSNVYDNVCPWIKIKAVDAGEATITLDYWYGLEYPNPDNPGYTIYDEKISGTETFVIKVAERVDFHIDNQIVTNGCLVPIVPNNLNNIITSYIWKRSDGATIKPAALKMDGSINVSTDRGGISNGMNPITYTVIAKDGNGNTVETDSFTVMYGNELLNPGFESPDHGNGFRTTAKSNNTEGLYWKTTAPGEGSHIGSDIEFGCGDGTSNPYGVGKAAEGKQFVELNCENAGALYQDILTTAGLKLDWSFSHGYRYNSAHSQDKMYVVLAATKDAQNVLNIDDIKNLLKSARETETSTNSDIPSSGPGFCFTHNDGTYYIWTHSTNVTPQTKDQWGTISGTYTVPENQYLTRLFLVSYPYVANPTFGNLVDAGSVSERISYRVEYYENGDKKYVEENKNATTYDTVKLENLSEFSKYSTAYKILINGEVYPGTFDDLKTSGLYLAEYGTKPEGSDVDIVLQIYFQENRISVTKEIVIEGWEELEEEEKEKILGSGLNVTFKLYVNGESEPEPLRTNVIINKVSSSGQLIAQGEFNNLSADYYNKELVVEEVEIPQINGYVLTSSSGSQSFTLKEDGENTKALKFINTYRIKTFDLQIQIKKNVGEKIDENQVFLFRVTGPKDFLLDVKVVGNGPVRIKELPVGTYTVTELTDWSWRYSMAENEKQARSISEENAVEGLVTCTFINKRSNFYWLSGDSYFRNWWGNLVGN